MIGLSANLARIMMAVGLATPGNAVAASVNPYQQWTDLNVVTSTLSSDATVGRGAGRVRVVTRSSISSGTMFISKSMTNIDGSRSYLDVYDYTVQLNRLKVEPEWYSGGTLTLNCQEGSCITLSRSRLLPTIDGGWQKPDAIAAVEHTMQLSITVVGPDTLSFRRAFARLVDPAKGDETVCLDFTNFPDNEQCPGYKVGDAYTRRRSEP